MKLNPNRQVTFSVKELRQRDKRIEEKAFTNSQRIVNLFPLLALRDEFGFGRKRMMRFIKKYHEIIQDYNKGYINFEDIAKVMKEEVKIDLEGLDD